MVSSLLHLCTLAHYTTIYGDILHIFAYFMNFMSRTHFSQKIAALGALDTPN